MCMHVCELVCMCGFQGTVITRVSCFVCCAAPAYERDECVLTRLSGLNKINIQCVHIGIECDI